MPTSIRRSRLLCLRTFGPTLPSGCASCSRSRRTPSRLPICFGTSPSVNCCAKWPTRSIWLSWRTASPRRASRTTSRPSCGSSVAGSRRRHSRSARRPPRRRKGWEESGCPEVRSTSASAAFKPTKNTFRMTQSGMTGCTSRLRTARLTRRSKCTTSRLKGRPRPATTSPSFLRGPKGSASPRRCLWWKTSVTTGTMPACCWRCTTSLGGPAGSPSHITSRSSGHDTACTRRASMTSCGRPSTPSPRTWCVGSSSPHHLLRTACILSSMP
mmetsp:Transcript_25372/g.76423  ORF Transcript_25372/g.76423 Transcript_25372/m.76423 type:complete len:270 (+) Transcript_25372:1342-2151(+)